MTLVKLKSKALSYIPENNRIERIWKLAQVDFKKRYYNDRFGLLWALINPVLRVLIYYFVFNLIFKTAIEGIDNYGLFIFSGLIVWMFFVETCKKSMKILHQKRYLILNIKVKKIDLFYSNGLAILMGFGFNLLALVFISFFFQVPYSIHLLFLPILIINLLCLSIGFGMILCILYAFFEDIAHVADIGFLLGFWCSGIFFRGELFWEYWPPIIYLNPFIGLVINFRNVLIYGAQIDYFYLLINFTYGLAILFLGIFLIRKYSHLAIEKL